MKKVSVSVANSDLSDLQTACEIQAKIDTGNFVKFMRNVQVLKERAKERDELLKASREKMLDGKKYEDLDKDQQMELNQKWVDIFDEIQKTKVKVPLFRYEEAAHLVEEKIQKYAEKADPDKLVPPSALLPLFGTIILDKSSSKNETVEDAK